MNLPLRLGYEAIAQLARTLAILTPDSRHKLLRTFSSRRGVRGRLTAFRRDVGRPLLWMHAPSVGEGLQARPVLDLVRARAPHTQLAYTYFSPSAERFASTLPVDFRDVLPFDTAGDARAALAALAPTALVFSKLDVWPTLARVAADVGVRLGLVSATLAAGSSRSTGVAGAILREAYARLDRVGAISAGDAERLTSLGVSPDRVTVTGDTRYDQVWARAAAAELDGPLLAPLASDRPTLVAGSTWPSDERHLLEAWASLASMHPEARLVIAPHEPTPGHLAPILRWCAAARLRCATLGTPESGTADVIVVDRVGVLGDLYALASVAYVGGAFHGAGLHSVLEPAAFGAPVLFGPRHLRSRDAAVLLDARAALSVHDTVTLRAALGRWFADVEDRRSAGNSARAVVRDGLGAAERSYQLVASLLA